MAVSRSYATGVTRPLIVSGTLSLLRCGGRFIKTPLADQGGFPVATSGWVGGDYFHMLTRQGDGVGAHNNDGSAILISFLGMTVEISTFLADRTPPGADYVWRTEIRHCGDVVQTWDEEAIEGTGPVTPETVTVSWSVSATFEEHLYELDGDAGATNRPQGARDPRFYYALKPTSNFVSTAYGDMKTRTPLDALGTDALLGESVIRTKEQLSLTVAGTPWGSNGEGTAPGPDENLPEADGKGDILEGQTYARVVGMSVMGTVPFWGSNFSYRVPGDTRCAQPDPDFPGNFIRFDTYSHLSSHAFVQRANEIGETLTGSHFYDLTIDGRVRNWNGPVNGIPVQFTVGRAPCLGTGPTSYPFTGSHTIDGQPDPLVLPPTGYQTDDNHCALFRIGNEWDALTLNRAPSLVVEDFARIGGANGWTEIDCATGPTYASGKLVVTGGGGSPRIDKTLKSDFTDLTANPEAWWTTHGAALSALTGTEQAEVAAWWAATGDPDSSPHVGDWYRIGRRLLSTSDVFNWSAWRYLDLRGYADADCDVTLRIQWEQIVFEQNLSSPYEVNLFPTTKTATFTVSLTTANADHRIDLASKCGHDGLRYVKNLRISFPAGRTLNLESLTLKEVARPVVDVHQPTGDLGYISALADGKHALFLSPRSLVPPSSVWGWPVFQWDQSINNWVSHLMPILATELSLQEGWTATVAGSPDHGSPNYAVWLKEAFEQPCPVRLKGRRSFGRGEVYPTFGQTLDMEANLGSAIHLLVFDPDTFLPVRVPVEADDSGGTQRDGAVTGAEGYARLEVHSEDEWGIYAAKGTPDESTAGVNALSRTWAALDLTGKEVAGSGPCVLEIDRIGNKWVVFVRDGKVTLARKLGAAADWEYLTVLPGSSPCLVVDETHSELRISVVFVDASGTILQASNLKNGAEGAWSELRIIGTGSQPSVRKDKKTGRTYYGFWKPDNGGSLVLKRSDDSGATFVETSPGSGVRETVIATGVAEQPSGLAFETDAQNTLVAVYSDGTDILSKTSVDDGRTWA